MRKCERQHLQDPTKSGSLDPTSGAPNAGLGRLEPMHFPPSLGTAPSLRNCAFARLRGLSLRINAIPETCYGLDFPPTTYPDTDVFLCWSTPSGFCAHLPSQVRQRGIRSASRASMSTEELPSSYFKETALRDSQRPVITRFPFAPELSRETPRI